MKELAIILPVHNERQSIEKVVCEWLKEIKKWKLNYQLVIVEDGSNDGTIHHLKKIQSKYRFTLLSSKRRLGYGVAILHAISKTNSEWILNVDSDGQYSSSDFSLFWRSRSSASVIIGNRVLRNDPLSRIFLSKLFGILFYFIFPKTKIGDPSCPFVLFRRRDVTNMIHLLLNVKEPFWWAFVGMCSANNISMIEVPVKHRVRPYGQTKSYVPSKYLQIFFTSLYHLILLRFKR